MPLPHRAADWRSSSSTWRPDTLTRILRGSTYQVIIITSVTVGLLLLALLGLFRREINQPVSRILGVMDAGPGRRPEGARSRGRTGRAGADRRRSEPDAGAAPRRPRRAAGDAPAGDGAAGAAGHDRQPRLGRRPRDQEPAGRDPRRHGGPGEQPPGRTTPKRDLTREIKAEVDRINRMVRDLLSYSREPNPETVPALVCDLLEDVITQARQLPDAARVEITPRVRLRLPGGGRLPAHQAGVPQHHPERLRRHASRRRASRSICRARRRGGSHRGSPTPAAASPRRPRPGSCSRSSPPATAAPAWASRSRVSIVQAHGGEITFASRARLRHHLHGPPARSWSRRRTPPHEHGHHPHRRRRAPPAPDAPVPPRGQGLHRRRGARPARRRSAWSARRIPIWFCSTTSSPTATGWRSSTSCCSATGTCRW